MSSAFPYEVTMVHVSLSFASICHFIVVVSIWSSIQVDKRVGHIFVFFMMDTRFCFAAFSVMSVLKYLFRLYFTSLFMVVDGHTGQSIFGVQSIMVRRVPWRTIPWNTCRALFSLFVSSCSVTIWFFMHLLLIIILTWFMLIEFFYWIWVLHTIVHLFNFRYLTHWKWWWTREAYSCK